MQSVSNSAGSSTDTNNMADASTDTSTMADASNGPSNPGSTDSHTVAAAGVLKELGASSQATTVVLVVVLLLLLVVYFIALQMAACSDFLEDGPGEQWPQSMHMGMAQQVAAGNSVSSECSTSQHQYLDGRLQQSDHGEAVSPGSKSAVVRQVVLRHGSVLRRRSCSGNPQQQHAASAASAQLHIGQSSSTGGAQHQAAVPPYSPATGAASALAAGAKTTVTTDGGAVAGAFGDGADSDMHCTTSHLWVDTGVHPLQSSPDLIVASSPSVNPAKKTTAHHLKTAGTSTHLAAPVLLYDSEVDGVCQQTAAPSPTGMMLNVPGYIIGKDTSEVQWESQASQERSALLLAGHQAQHQHQCHYQPEFVVVESSTPLPGSMTHSATASLYEGGRGCVNDDFNGNRCDGVSDICQRPPVDPDATSTDCNICTVRTADSNTTIAAAAACNQCASSASGAMAVTADTQPADGSQPADNDARGTSSRGAVFIQHDSSGSRRSNAQVEEFSSYPGFAGFGRVPHTANTAPNVNRVATGLGDSGAIAVPRGAAAAGVSGWMDMTGMRGQQQMLHPGKSSTASALDALQVPQSTTIAGQSRPPARHIASQASFTTTSSHPPAQQLQVTSMHGVWQGSPASEQSHRVFPLSPFASHDKFNLPTEADFLLPSDQEHGPGWSQEQAGVSDEHQHLQQQQQLPVPQGRFLKSDNSAQRVSYDADAMFLGFLKSNSDDIRSSDDETVGFCFGLQRLSQSMDEVSLLSCQGHHDVAVGQQSGQSK